MTDCEARTGPSETREDDGPLVGASREACTPEAGYCTAVMDLVPGEWFRLAGEQSRRLFMVTDGVELMGRTRTPMVAANGLGLDSSLRIRRCRVRGDRVAIPLAGYALLGALADVVDGYTPSPLSQAVSV